MAGNAFELALVTCEANVGFALTYDKAVANVTHARRPCVPDPFSQIVKKGGGMRIMELETSFSSIVIVFRNGRLVCIAKSQNSARMLLEEAAMALGDRDIVSMDATFTFTGGQMTYRTGVPVDLSIVAAHAHACGPSTQNLQGLRVNGSVARVFSNGALMVHKGTSVDDMKQTLLATCDIVHASDGDTN